MDYYDTKRNIHTCCFSNNSFAARNNNKWQLINWKQALSFLWYIYIFHFVYFHFQHFHIYAHTAINIKNKIAWGENDWLKRHLYAVFDAGKHDIVSNMAENVWLKYCWWSFGEVGWFVWAIVLLTWWRLHVRALDRGWEYRLLTMLTMDVDR